MEEKPNIFQNIDKEHNDIDWKTIRKKPKEDNISPVVITICTVLTGVLIAVIVSYIHMM